MNKLRSSCYWVGEEVGGGVGGERGGRVGGWVGEGDMQCYGHFPRSITSVLK